MEILLQKKPIKYLASADEPTRNKLYKALEGLKELNGDIVKLKGTDNLYRLKIEHYRIVFSIEKGALKVIVISINTRTNTKYRRMK
ncbi:type II toxin-antitoxin system RelE/ParE family toxin [uncultured Oscillibacter sp.]|uniref:type II toxin-antitoxin system RelE family toxin n=1 Tax=uncultured Oscillibacter sp. TaxID=876091 RepID=UPI0025DB00FF|nr:type II toxin-antitoxin system RelE/ParE family toxin [uncultured Oscillibacter sp.]